ncbi:endolytic transglycosylase MltG, partial [Sphaerisporangium sp. NPDC088356]|uniref:endolytic transglycosylase MltG n=1 Tax=Sphaerisporangium sp. NPDC088356 TaxID=3154871 RepID=UPI00341F3D1D
AMVARYKRAADDAALVAGARRVGRTPLEIMTIASIVQAESGNVRDMPKVARVIYNRLNRTPQMKLQMDSTVMYGLNKFGIAATHEEIKSTSPYNTYARLGLPPGPIGNPGDHAIEAALKPADGTWLFFVTTDPKRGITKFTDSETEFFKLAEEFNQNHRAG